MKLLICGSAAAEGIPALFCGCRLCKKSFGRRKDTRSRTAYQFGEELRIDFGPDNLLHAQKYNLHFERLRHLFLTHSHADHLFSGDLYWRRPGFSMLPKNSFLDVYGNASAGNAIKHTLADKLEDAKMAFHLLSHGKKLKIKRPAAEIIPLNANHDKNQEPFIFIIGIGGKWTLVGNDTGWFPDETWEFLNGYVFNTVVLDCTMGRKKCRNNHMGVSEVVETFGKLKEMGCLSRKTRRIANHFSHNGGMLHSDLEKYFSKFGIVPAYDGMTLKI
ncbi:MAG TPA: hypothetical protein DCZ94_10335 [Lentisphaeria bacterium]|nr:MAG: hypothetical protein A2X48_23865 [Lentisphaerae bacterium GWF2_49_21]HBC87342.1 hypothetical protein [Lentisphaeria bacterium]